ncbi:MAG: YafY family transcriptional regulator [Sandaracinaceae bacterium]|nr:YafY family transcriptional regulator [Sandaracinaceae bacterium]
MRRADRLFQIIQLLRRRGGAVTARRLAEQLEVSERTIYRDVRDLIASGTPIEGEAGVGYFLRKGYDLPPLMFDAEEIQALVLGARVVEGFGDERLAKAADRVLAKIEAVLPSSLRSVMEETSLYAVGGSREARGAGALGTVREALRSKHKLRIEYERPDGEASSRVVRPLGAFFWGRTWTLTAWCELRNGFRNFRLDRMRSCAPLGERFGDEPGRTLRDFLRTVDGEGLLDG